MKVSNCCGVKGDYKMGEYIPCTFENFNACPKCGEHCEYIEETHGCEAGDHDEVPILGYENAITGYQCRQCGKKL